MSNWKLIYVTKINVLPPVTLEIFSAGNNLFRLKHTIHNAIGNTVIESQGNGEQIKRAFNQIINKNAKRRKTNARHKKLQTSKV